MNIITVRNPNEIPVKSWDWHLYDTPEAAALAVSQKFNIPLPDTVYVWGHSVAVPLNIEPPAFWEALKNEV